jgi:hypothetical protein
MKISHNEMRLSIRQTHGFDATRHVETIKVECHSYQPVLSFDVCLFDIEDHPTATQCYAWGVVVSESRIMIPAVLRSSQIFNAEQAICSYLAGQEENA